jgi:CBS domain-containing protein
VSDVAEFLGRYPPFSHAGPVELEHLATAAQLVSAEPGTAVLIEDGPVSTGVYVVRHGSVELVHDDEAVDVLDVGEAFGHPSMLTGQAPAFTVRARERCDLILIPAREAVPHLTGEFVASTLRARMIHTSVTWCTGRRRSARPPTACARRPNGWPRRTSPASWSSWTAAGAC